MLNPLNTRHYFYVQSVGRFKIYAFRGNTHSAAEEVIPTFVNASLFPKKVVYLVYSCVLYSISANQYGLYGVNFFCNLTFI